VNDTGHTDVRDINDVNAVNQIHDLDPLADRLAGAAGAAPTWRPFTAEAMQVVHRRARRRQATERVISVACGLFAIAIAATTIAALDGGDGDRARTLRTADHTAEPADPSFGEGDPLVDASATPSTTVPHKSFNGRDPLVNARGEVTASTPVGTFPPLATPTTGPTPSTTAPRIDDTKPPTSFAALNGVEVEAKQGPSCWERSGKTACEEKDSYWFEDAPVLEGIQSGSLWFRWALHEQPKEIIATSRFATPDAKPETIRCEGGNPCRIEFGVVSFGTAPSWIVIETRWEHGTVTHAIKVRSHPVDAS